MQQRKPTTLRREGARVEERREMLHILKMLEFGEQNIQRHYSDLEIFMQGREIAVFRIVIEMLI